MPFVSQWRPMARDRVDSKRTERDSEDRLPFDEEAWGLADDDPSSTQPRFASVSEDTPLPVAALAASDPDSEPSAAPPSTSTAESAIDPLDAELDAAFAPAALASAAERLDAAQVSSASADAQAGRPRGREAATPVVPARLPEARTPIIASPIVAAHVPTPPAGMPQVDGTPRRTVVAVVILVVAMAALAGILALLTR